jgi:cell division protein FtsW
MVKKLKFDLSWFKNNIFVLTVAVVCFGLVVLADVSAPEAQRNFSDKYYFVKQQSLWGLIGVIAMIVTSKIDYNYWKKVAIPMFFVSVFFLIIVLIPGIGTSALGARRWIIIGNNSFQPSEFVKFSILVYLARVNMSHKKIQSYLIPLAIVGGLIMLEPDLGTTIVVMTIGFAQIFISGVNIFYIMGAGAAGAIISSILVLTSSYRRDRLLTFFSQTHDPLGKGYHIRQILLALGSGGLTGVGIGQSRQKYLFLPEAATDSIFAIVAEEIGFLGASIIIILFTVYIYLGLRVVKNAPDDFSKSLAVGIVAWIGGQAFLNIGSMVALIPLTGIPLPFFSYGGSSLVMLLCAVGILVNISKNIDVKRR